MVNCSDPKEYSPVQSNPDVAGTGVLIGFVGTGFTTILLLLLHYLFVHDPTLDPFRRDDQPDLRSNKANPPDVIFLRKARWLLQLVGVQLRLAPRSGTAREARCCIHTGLDPARCASVKFRLTLAGSAVHPNHERRPDRHGHCHHDHGLHLGIAGPVGLPLADAGLYGVGPHPFPSAFRAPRTRQLLAVS